MKKLVCRTLAVALMIALVMLGVFFVRLSIQYIGNDTERTILSFVLAAVSFFDCFAPYYYGFRVIR